MSVRNIVPWRRSAPATYRGTNDNPFLSLHREMNRLFDDAFRGFDGNFPAFDRLPGFAAGWPSVEVNDREGEIRVSAEMPGLEQDDVELLLEDDTLVLRGDKKSETEDSERQFTERYYGHFERRIPLGYEVDQDKVDASFKNGVLTVTLPKTTQENSKAKRISIKN